MLLLLLGVEEVIVRLRRWLLHRHRHVVDRHLGAIVVEVVICLTFRFEVLFDIFFDLDLIWRTRVHLLLYHPRLRLLLLGLLLLLLSM